jgi:hypothetical protein
VNPPRWLIREMSTRSLRGRKTLTDLKRTIGVRRTSQGRTRGRKSQGGTRKTSEIGVMIAVGMSVEVMIVAVRRDEMMEGEMIVVAVRREVTVADLVAVEERVKAAMWVSRRIGLVDKVVRDRDKDRHQQPEATAGVQAMPAVVVSLCEAVAEAAPGVGEVVQHRPTQPGAPATQQLRELGAQAEPAEEEDYLITHLTHAGEVRERTAM